MNKSIATAAMLLLMAFSVIALGDVVIRLVPITWENTAHLEGDELFNNLCASCHGPGGKGDGPAVSALQRPVPDLTMISLKNDGIYSHKRVERIIYGESRDFTHDTINMPAWGQQFMYVRSGWSSFQRQAYARERIHTLNKHLESIQVTYAD